MKFRQIEAFRAVMNAGSATMAGQLLYISQPAISRLIANLEHEVGFKLFERKRNRLVPTSEGRILHVEVKRAFASLDRIEDVAKSIRNMKEGHLRVIATPMIAHGILPRIIGEFLEQYTEITLELQSGPRDMVIDGITSQQYDLAIETPGSRNPGVTERQISRQSALCVLPGDHPLAKKSVIHAQDMVGEYFVSLPSAAAFQLRIDEIFRTENVKRKIRVETLSQQSMCNLVEAGIGLAIVSPYLRHDIEGRDLVLRPFRPNIPIDFALMHPTLRPPSIIGECFIQFVVKHFDKNY